jgi:hypothetical protein
MKILKYKLFSRSFCMALLLLVMTGCQTMGGIGIIKTTEEVEKEYYECLYTAANNQVGKGATTNAAVDGAIKACSELAQRYGESIAGSVGSANESRYQDSRTHFKPHIESEARKALTDLINKHRV